ncbi:MAG: ABC transporter substrate-binding protein, partial [Desulfurococcales archaeon]|nr:ABC transporter substrate-binding protein [Desulfurococcales archaeon]
MKAKWIALVMALLFIAAPVLAGVASAQQQPVTIKIGALLPLTGDLQSYGERAQAAVEFAVQEMNQYLKEKNAWFRLQLIVEDTQTKPDVAVQKFSSLVAQGVKFIVG